MTTRGTSGRETERKFLLSSSHADVERIAAETGALRSRRLLQQRYLPSEGVVVRLSRSWRSPGRAAHSIEFAMPDGGVVRLSIDRDMHDLLAPHCREDEPDAADPNGISRLRLRKASQWTIRVRRSTDVTGMNVRCELTMKRPVSDMTCDEPESPISSADHDALAAHCGTAVRKRRIRISHGGRTWDVDGFSNPELEGLALAEVELPSEDAVVLMPSWVGREVTGLKEYRNAVIQRRVAA